MALVQNQPIYLIVSPTRIHSFWHSSMRERGMPKEKKETLALKLGLVHSSHFPSVLQGMCSGVGIPTGLRGWKPHPSGLCFSLVPRSTTPWGGVIKKHSCFCPPSDPVSGPQAGRLTSEAWGKEHERCLWGYSWENLDKDFAVRQVLICVSSLLMNSCVPWRKPSLSPLQCPHLYSRH